MVTLSFTRKQFSDFVFKHVQTPSEETRQTFTGFELTKDRLKSFVDKLDYYVEKNNRLMNKEFSSTISIDERRILKRGSYVDFFDVDTFEAGFVRRISITLSYLIDFGLEGGPAQPEKQVVVLRFDTNQPADIVTEIRTTEFTWPAAIFNILKNEIDDLSGELRDAHPISSSPLFFPARLISKQDFSLRNSMSTISLAAAFFAFFIFTEQDLIKYGDKETAYIFDHEKEVFSEIDPDIFFKSGDWRDKLSLLRDSEELRSYVGGSSGGYDGEVTKTMTALDQLLSLPAWFYMILIILTVLTWLNFREAARIENNRVGRIWLSSRKQPERQRVAASDGVLAALVTGVMGSAVFATIIAVLGSLAK
ncbi:hypothetical protein CSE45_2561 [Citreicella sp. SE45]|nr:hypothetical protein CSE45_2561 [Citreicella sp. SE45]